MSRFWRISWTGAEDGEYGVFLEREGEGRLKFLNSRFAHDEAYQFLFRENMVFSII